MHRAFHYLEAREEQSDLLSSGYLKHIVLKQRHSKRKKVHKQCKKNLTGINAELCVLIVIPDQWE